MYYLCVYIKSKIWFLLAWLNFTEEKKTSEYNTPAFLWKILIWRIAVGLKLSVNKYFSAENNIIIKCRSYIVRKFSLKSTISIGVH